jgi:hypothetical protein
MLSLAYYILRLLKTLGKLISKPTSLGVLCFLA